MQIEKLIEGLKGKKLYQVIYDNNLKIVEVARILDKKERSVSANYSRWKKANVYKIILDERKLRLCETPFKCGECGELANDGKHGLTGDEFALVNDLICLKRYLEEKPKKQKNKINESEKENGKIQELKDRNFILKSQIKEQEKLIKSMESEMNKLVYKYRIPTMTKIIEYVQDKYESDKSNSLYKSWLERCTTGKREHKKIVETLEFIKQM